MKIRRVVIVVKEYVIDWDNFEKVVGNQAVELKRQFDGFLVLLNLTNHNNEFDYSDFDFGTILSIFSDDLSDFYFDGQHQDDSLYLQKIDELQKQFNDCLDFFEKETEIKVVLDVCGKKDSEFLKGYMCLDVFEYGVGDCILIDKFNDLLDKLKNRGIEFDLIDKKNLEGGVLVEQ
jgi:hypothetical protein